MIQIIPSNIPILDVDIYEYIKASIQDHILKLSHNSYPIPGLRRDTTRAALLMLARIFNPTLTFTGSKSHHKIARNNEKMSSFGNEAYPKRTVLDYKGCKRVRYKIWVSEITSNPTKSKNSY